MKESKEQVINMDINNNIDKQIVEGEIIAIVGNELKRIANDKKLGLDYTTICACALGVLDDKLGEGYDFPIDIEVLAREFDIEVVYQPLNSMTGRQDGRAHKVVGRNLKRINRVTNEPESYILIDDESRYDEQRYALAHELAHYLINAEEKRFNSEYYVMPMLFKKMEEMVADIFAIFLLIPLPIFLREFAVYIGNQSAPIKTSEWLKYLSWVTDVPYEDVAIGYQNLRYVCGVIYGAMNGEIEIENENDKVNVILQKQRRKIEDVLTESVIEKLFC